MDMDQWLVSGSPTWNPVVDGKLRQLPVYLREDKMFGHNKKLHVQPGLEINISHEGRAAMVVGSSVHMQSRQCLSIVPGHVPHQVFPAGTMPYRRTVICLDDSLLDVSRLRGEAGGLDWLGQSYLFHRLDARTYAELNALARKMQQEMKRTHSGWQAMLLSYMLAMAVTVSRFLERSETRSAAAMAHEEETANYIWQCTDYIERNLHEDLTLHGMARQFAVSPEHLTRMFRKETGVTLYQYVLMRRVEESKKLLRQQKDKTIAEIAYSLGFTSSSQFNRVFKSMASMTPSEYRHQ